jgi:hypothetical protein
MIEIADIWAVGATLGCIVLAYLYLSTRIDRDEARADLSREQLVVQAFENRVTTLRGDNLAFESQVKALTEANTELQREVGRLKAAKVAMKPKRGPNGRFISKGNTPA